MLLGSRSQVSRLPGQRKDRLGHSGEELSSVQDIGELKAGALVLGSRNSEMRNARLASDTRIARGVLIILKGEGSRSEEVVTIFFSCGLHIGFNVVYVDERR